MGDTALQSYLEDPLLGPVRGPAAATVAAVLGTEHLAVVDTEFTPRHIVEVGLSRLRPFRHFAADGTLATAWGFELPHTWLVDPGEPVPAPVTRSCGVVDADVRGAGPFAAHVPRLAQLLAHTEYLIGWNVGNDRNKLEAELRRAGVSHPRLLWVDLARMFHRLHPRVGASPARICKLAQACAFYGIDLPPERAHHALFDVLATCQVLTRVCQEWAEQRPGDALPAIEVTGHHGAGWDPAVLAAPVGPVRWRLPAGDRQVNRRLYNADRWLRGRAVHERQSAERRRFQAGLRRLDPTLSWAALEQAWQDTGRPEQLRAELHAAREPASGPVRPGWRRGPATSLTFEPAP